MGCGSIDTKDEIGREIQKIMDSNQREIDKLKMKCSFLELKLLNSNGNQGSNIEDILKEYQNYAAFQKDNNNNNYIIDIENNNSLQKYITIIFSINNTIYSINTNENAGLRDVYFFLLNKIKDNSY